jgi:hypothetical protein
MMSVALPALNGMKALIGLAGQSCAEASELPKETQPARQAETIKSTRFIVILFS